MAKVEVEKVEKPELRKVRFTQPFEGSWNNFKIRVTQADFNNVKVGKYDEKKGVFVKASSEILKRDLPIDVYNWLQKFEVSTDA